MSNGGGGDKPKTGLIWAIIPATAVCAVIIGAGWLQAAKYERQADKQIADYAEYTKSKKANGCVQTARADNIACLNAASDAYREYRYNQRDLVAQKTSALWAFIMGAAAVIGMALSAVGVWLVRETFKEARDGNVIALKSHIAQSRAWLIVNTVEPEWRYRFSDEEIEIFGEVYFVIENTGQSAASEIWTRTAVGNPNGIWGELFKAQESPLPMECLPPKGTTRISENFAISIPVKSKDNLLKPQMACIQITYNGGGTDRFTTECILTVSGRSDAPEIGWGDGHFLSYAGERATLDAFSHFGYFRTVT